MTSTPRSRQPAPLRAARGLSRALCASIFSAALNTASTGSACDWLGSLLASQLGSGLVLTNTVNRAPELEITSTSVTYAAAGLLVAALAHWIFATLLLTQG